MTPVALIKAESLAAFARHSGVPLSEFALSLTLGEGYELLDFLAAGGMGKVCNQTLLEADIAEAKVRGDPFVVLANFQLLGFDIQRADRLN